jgi:serine/threonine-protein kinase
VYRADDLRLAGRVTAVKEIHPDPDASDALRAEAQEQFRREAETLATLDHPALPKVSDYFVEHGADFLVMDFVDGPDLRQVIDERRAEGAFLEESEVIDWSLQLLDVLIYLHGREPPVVHRDIKPANIKLVSGGRVKLVDFGLVKPLDPADPRTLTVARGIGSLPYTPLEQYAGDTGFTDARSDLYSLGATMYHLLTAVPPATAQERFLMPNALVRPSSINAAVSPRTEKTVLAAMALHPERRPESALAMREQLLGRRSGPSQSGLAGGTEADAQAGADDIAPGYGQAWVTAVIENLGLVAIVALMLLLALLATWQSERARSTLDPDAATSSPTPARSEAHPTLFDVR